MSNIFADYYRYQSQSGGGFGSEEEEEEDLGIYRASPNYYRQRGYGFLSFLSSAFRYLKPLIFSSGKKVGQELLRTGGNILQDIADKPADVRVGDIALNQVKEGSKRAMTRLMTGTGKRRRRAVSTAPARRRRGKAPRRKKRAGPARRIKRVPKRKVGQSRKGGATRRRTFTADCFS